VIARAITTLTKFGEMMFEVVIAIVAGLLSILSAMTSSRSSRHHALEHKSSSSENLTVRQFVALLSLGWGSGHLSERIRPFLAVGRFHVEALAALVLLVAVSSLLLRKAVRDRTAGANARLQLNLFALWASYVSGWSAAHGEMWEDIVVAFGGWWLGCSVVGAMLVAAGRIWRRQTDGVDPPSLEPSFECETTETNS
jgi:hypothetical protein